MELAGDSEICQIVGLQAVALSVKVGLGLKEGRHHLQAPLEGLLVAVVGELKTRHAE